MLLKNFDKTALIWKDLHISYRELLNHVGNYTFNYENRDVNKVAVFSENRLEWVYALYSTWLDNKIFVPIDFMSTAEDVAYILNDCRPEVVFFSEKTEKVLNAAEKDLKYKPHFLDIEKYRNESATEIINAIENPDPDRTVLIIYTSGTTGNPKGVMLSFDNIKANIELLTSGKSYYTETNRVLVLLPLHHVLPLLGSLVATLYAGGTAVFSPSLNSADILETLANNKITMIIGVPRLYNSLHKGIMEKINSKFISRLIFKMLSLMGSIKLSKKVFAQVHAKFGGHIEHLVAGGAKLDMHIAKDFRTLGFEIAEGYGMTETAPMISFPPYGEIKLGSTGKPVTTLDVKVKDGEILVKGRNVMQGYYNKPEETAEVIKDGWLYTGDLGNISTDGYLNITGRKKEIIVLSNGKNINPVLIESKISVMSGLIAEIAVFLKNDQLQAVIFPDFIEIEKLGINNIEESIRWDVIDAYNQKAAPYKRIHNFFITKEELAKTRLGKIKRFQLEKMEFKKAKIKDQIEDPEFAEYQTIKSYLKDQTKTEISPDDHFEIDLGLDSLDKISFQAFLSSTFGIELQDNLLINHPTVLKLSNFVQEKKKRFKVEAVKWGEIFQEKIDFKLPKRWITQNILKSCTKLFLKVYFKLKGQGMDNIPDGPVILAPNHQSFFDSLYILAFLKNKLMKKTYFYAKEKHIKRKWLKFLAGRHNVIIMDINKDLKQSLKKMAEILKKGKNIIIFPEGTRSKDGNLGKFKKTFAILAKELNIPVVPIAISGAFKALPRGKMIPKPFKTISVNFLEPVYPTGHNYSSLADTVYNKIANSQLNP